MTRLQVTLIVLVSIGSSFAYRKCRMPNGYTGECRYLVKCKPMLEVNEKKLKTDEELLYLRQSSCGTTSNFRYKVCCPLQSDWTKTLEIKPALYPELVEYNFEPGARNHTNSSTYPEYKGVEDEEYSSKVVPAVQDNIKPINAFETNVDSDECGVHSHFSNSVPSTEGPTAKQYPWLVLLEYANGGINCGGSLISSRYVMTAGHCVDTFNGPPISARLSEFNTTSYPNDFVRREDGLFEVITVTIISIEWSESHPLFNKNNYHHDIGLVKMTKDVQYSDYIRPICLPSSDYAKQFDAYTNFMVAGWGGVGGYYSDVKRDVMLPYMTLKACKRSYPTRTLSNKQICAEGESGRWAGDSGGPLMFEYDDSYAAVGVASYGSRESGVANVPSVYTNVYEYVEWIRRMME